MPANLCLACHFKYMCDKNQYDALKCSHRRIVKKMLRNLSMGLNDIESQNIEDKEINIIDELLAK